MPPRSSLSWSSTLSRSFPLTWCRLIWTEPSSKRAVLRRRSSAAGRRADRSRSSFSKPVLGERTRGRCPALACSGEGVARRDLGSCGLGAGGCSARPAGRPAGRRVGDDGWRAVLDRRLPTSCVGWSESSGWPPPRRDGASGAVERSDGGRARLDFLGVHRHLGQLVAVRCRALCLGCSRPSRHRRLERGARAAHWCQHRPSSCRTRALRTVGRSPRGASRRRRCAHAGRLRTVSAWSLIRRRGRLSPST